MFPVNAAPHYKNLIAIVVVLVILAVGPVQGAWAKKKDSAADAAAQAAAQLQKTLDPISKQLDDLMAKVQGRALFSPQDAGVLGNIKYQLMDLMNDHPRDIQMAKPVYEAAVIYSQREEYNDAYELFTYVSDHFPTSPYGLKAHAMVADLQRKLGADYFPKDDVIDPAAAQSAGAMALPAAGKK